MAYCDKKYPLCDLSIYITNELTGNLWCCSCGCARALAGELQFGATRHNTRMWEVLFSQIAPTVPNAAHHTVA